MEKDINDPTSVTELIQNLDPEFGELVEAVRKIILGTNQSIGERIKWNSPSFFYMGEMTPFDPKEYKRDIVVMNLRKGKVLLVFPTGEKIKDHSGILEGNYTDGRRLITLNNLADAKNKASDLQAVLSEWISIID
ncbi:DUF1801 domain-containing protein [Persicitalea jodogahamensis]|uniref:YdhG-like domain-containing protein n=1 Tax=Persicitalea jodogahamensis TaxID=402147 RepID=A0A8J3D2M2_9BACT|nr:DUF1801 domain-containing protein [Persicitalea jodogahamensis]GHB62501.1 hypothetical protein GCM10007390_15400 [Persicitalea jodogahamensis]